MKKITLTLAALVMTVVGFSQTVFVDRPADGASSIIATSGNDGTGVFIADSFTASETISLGSVSVEGTNSSGASLAPVLDGWNVFIYADNGGTPGSGVQPQVSDLGVVELAITNDEFYTAIVDDATGSDWTINLAAANGGAPIELVAGTYWMVIFPSVSTAPTGDGRWNWSSSAGPAPIPNLLIDPQDLFGAGATDWTELGLLVAGTTSCAWVLTDEVVLGVDSEELAAISIFPNPASDLLNINVPASVELNGATLFDVLGKATNVSLFNGQINVSGLARGVYILNVDTSAGTLTEKVIIE